MKIEISKTPISFSTSDKQVLIRTNINIPFFVARSEDTPDDEWFKVDGVLKMKENDTLYFKSFSQDLTLVVLEL